MLKTRLIAAFLIGSLVMASAYAASETTTKASSVLTSEEIQAIQKECSKENDNSMTSKAYQTCVKEKEDAAIDKTLHHKNH